MARKSAPKTNAMRALDAHKIPYSTFVYPETIHSADEVAVLLGVPASQVYKTLVVLAEGGRRLLVMAPGGREIDLRLLARKVGAKSAQMTLQREAERLTGLKVGGISPLALLDKRFEVYLDATAAGLDEIYLNGGQRGINLKLRVDDLVTITGARLVAASSPA